MTVDAATTSSQSLATASTDGALSQQSHVAGESTSIASRQGRITPIVLRDATKWRHLNYKFISLGIKIERAVAVDAGIRILPKTEDDYRRIVRLLREEDVPHHTFPLPSERNIHAVVRGIPAMFSEQEIKGELEQRGYTHLHIIRLKRSGGAPMPLVVVILPKIEKSQLFNEHELLGLAIRVEVQKNSRLIGQCHHCQRKALHEAHDGLHQDQRNDDQQLLQGRDKEPAEMNCSSKSLSFENKT
ncbi:unnamed protein product [Acanthoscelides obtectus]|uniref:Pre-C2HC domain-containing protein n=1 Tax=Acanthoscelides obtectus TaxID=200917 RepID=A0A9P0LP37_ACAOB|nr:unnamed protein product [Acanthoscelides obtectus]CAK1668604.1 hypothetical protein AOBTE_LOCUS26508 [Acanthoscelides obtectus]